MKTVLLIAFFVLFAFAAFAQTKSKTDTTKTGVAPSPFRMHFDDLFKKNPDGSTSPVQQLMINGEMIPTSTKLANGIKYGGLDIMGNTGRDLLVDTLKGVVIVHGFVK